MNEKLKNYIDWIQYDELIAGVNNCPHKLLGNHIYDGHQIICAYRPAADYIKIFDRNGKNENTMDTTMLSLSIGTTTLAGPSCSAR